ncbi:MAG: alcohol dehydrogenase catalytic domain-containing protein [Eubacteriaceae bacterium]|nr:alcohol dehydrogenase catalytic domain-containing protein [Eubacteriaceae bacterium]
MKALFLTGKAQVEYKEVPTPECPDDGLLLRVEAVGLCGSDVRNYTHGSTKITYPVVLGHENAGVVIEAGKDVKEYKVGDKLVLNPAIPCGKCYYCENDNRGLCENLKVVGTDVQGGFAQYMAIPGEMLERGQILRIPEGIAFEQVVLAELLSSVIHAQEMLEIGLNDTVVIVGSGPIGCLHSQIAKLRGATTIVMADINQERVDICRPFGATHFVNSAEVDLTKYVKDLTNGIGADVVIVAAPSAQPHQPALLMLKKEGRLSLFGGLSKDDPWTKLDGNLIHYHRLKVIGAYSYSPCDFQKGFDLLAGGHINMDLITHKLPLKDMEEGVKLIQTGKALKVVLLPQVE